MDGFLRILRALVSHVVVETEQPRAHHLTSVLLAHFKSILRNSQDLSSLPLLAALNIVTYSPDELDRSAILKQAPYAHAYRQFRQFLGSWLLEWFNQDTRESSCRDFMASLVKQCEAITAFCQKKKYDCAATWHISKEGIWARQAQIEQVYEGFCQKKRWEMTTLTFCPSTEVGIVQKFLELMQLRFYEVDAECVKRWVAVMALPLELTIKEYCDELYSPVYKAKLEQLTAAIEQCSDADETQLEELTKQLVLLEEAYKQHFFDKFPQSFFVLLRVALIYDSPNPLNSWSFFQKTCQFMQFTINEDEHLYLEGLFRHFRLQAKLDADALPKVPDILETNALFYRLGKRTREQFHDLSALDVLDFFAKLLSWQKLAHLQKNLSAAEFVRILFALFMLFMRQDENNLNLYPRDFKIKSSEPELKLFEDETFLCQLEQQCAYALFYDISISKTTLGNVAQGIISKPNLQSWFAGLRKRDIYHPEQVYSAVCLFKHKPPSRVAEEKIKPIEPLPPDDDESFDSSPCQEQKESKREKRCSIL